jgi:hypothetical protein
VPGGPEQEALRPWDVCQCLANTICCILSLSFRPQRDETDSHPLSVLIKFISTSVLPFFDLFQRDSLHQSNIKMVKDRLEAMRVRSIYVRFIFIILILRCRVTRVSCSLFLLSQPTDTIFRPTLTSPYSQPSYEMVDVGNSMTRLASATPPPGNMPAFYSEVRRRRAIAYLSHMNLYYA